MKAGNSGRSGKDSGNSKSGGVFSAVELPNGCSNSGFVLSSYGVRIAIGATEPRILKRVPEDLLPGSKMAGTRKADVGFFIARDEQSQLALALRVATQMRDSMISAGQGGIGDLVNPDENGKDWAKLSDRERDRILQSMSEGFPPEYRTVLERYYRRLAEEKSGKAAGEGAKTKSVPSSKP